MKLFDKELMLQCENCEYNEDFIRVEEKHTVVNGLGEWERDIKTDERYECGNCGHEEIGWVPAS